MPSSPMHARPPKAFLSYSHDSPEHLARVLTLADRLRADGIDAWLDRYESVPAEGWAQWAQDSVERADFVLVVCTEVYRKRSLGHEKPGGGVGARFEAILLEEELDATSNLSGKFIPVIFSLADVQAIPVLLQPLTYYDLSTKEGYEGLYRHLIGQPKILAPSIGRLRPLISLEPQPQDLLPNYPNAATRKLADALAAAQTELEELREQGRDTKAARQDLLRLRREMREGGRLQAGDFLLDGRFRLLQIIGRGGFGSVWKAYDRESQRFVAIKVLHGQFAEDRSRRDRFFRGARTMAQLRHPGIVRVLEDQLEDEGFRFFVMEYLEGDLRAAVLARRLSQEAILVVVGEIGTALQFAHERGVVHRDIKPSNILLDADGHPKLADFDLAWLLDSTGGTITGPLGSFLYAAPESLQAGRSAGPAADVYSLGMTTIFALSGTDLPSDVLRSPEKLIADLPVDDGLRQTLLRAVEWNVERRWPSVATFCQALTMGVAPGAFDGAKIGAALGTLFISGAGNILGSEIGPILAAPRTTFDAFEGDLPWGKGFLRRLREDGFEPTDCRALESGRWLVRVRLPRTLSELYGTAPEILHLAVADEVRGGDLRRAQQELHRFGFELDLDLLVVTDGLPDLASRLYRITQLWGQWVPWSPVDGIFPPLSERLATALPIYDVFERQDPVRGRQMIGRGDVVADLSRRMLQGDALGLFGLRKMGKTTVVRAATDRLDPVSARLSLSPEGVLDLGRERSSVLVAWLDCLRVYDRTVQQVAELLRRELETRCELARLPIPAAELEKSPLANLDSLLRSALKAATVPICIVLDEYDLLFEGSAGQPGVEGIEKLFGMLRAHAQETGRLSLIVIGRDAEFFERPEMGGWPNPMLQWFHPRWLGPMVPAEAQELLQRLGRRVRLDVGEKTVHLAREWTGGHPLLQRQIGSALLGLARDGAQSTALTPIPTDPYCEEAVDPFLDRGAVMTICREVLELLARRYPEAADLFCQLCRRPSSMAPELIARQGGSHQPSIRALENFGLLAGPRREPTVPNIYRWYVQTFAPDLYEKTA